MPSSGRRNRFWTVRGCFACGRVTFCANKKSPKSRQRRGGFRISPSPLKSFPLKTTKRGPPGPLCGIPPRETHPEKDAGFRRGGHMGPPLQKERGHGVRRLSEHGKQIHLAGLRHITPQSCALRGPLCFLILGRSQFALRKFSRPAALRIYGLPAAPLCGVPVSAS